MSCKEHTAMQAFEGYLENGRFFPIGKPMRIVGRRRVRMTVLDEPAELLGTGDMSREEYLAIIDELCGSIDDPTFVSPPEIPWEHNAPRREIV